MRERLDVFGLDAALGFGPGGRLFDAVFLAGDVVEELLPAERVRLEEFEVGFLRGDELVDHAEHERAVRARTRRDPAAIQIFGRVGLDRVDRDRLRALLAQSADVARAVVQRREPVDVVRHERIAAPEDHALGMLEDAVPRGRARIARADDVGKNLRNGGGRIAVFAADVAAAEVEEAVLEVDGGVDLARRHPAVGAAEDGGGAVRVVDALDFLGGEVERRLPAHAHELFIAALFAGGGAVLEEAFAHHRIADARGRVGQLAEAVQVDRRRIVVLEGPDLHELAAGNVGADDAPARRRDDVACVDGGLAEVEGACERQVVFSGRREARSARLSGGVAGVCGGFGGLRFGCAGRKGSCRRRSGGGTEELAASNRHNS